MIGTLQTTWPRLLTGEIAEQARATVADIARALREPPPAWIPDAAAEPYRRARGASLAHGSCGLALFYEYLRIADLVVPGIDAAAESERRLAEVYDVIADLPLQAGFISGLTGALWTDLHLKRLRGEVDPEPLAMGEELCGYPVVRDGFDLYNGIVGHGVYALEHAADPTAQRLLTDIVARLDDVASADDDGLFWITDPAYLKPNSQRRHPRPYYNLGMAHGQAGVVAFLARALAVGVDPARTRRLLDGGADWLGARVATGATGRYVPVTHIPNAAPVCSLEAWCNGTPGAAAALLLAAHAAERPDWRDLAVSLARDAAARALADKNCRDASLCHGSAGEAMLWHRFLAATGERVFADAALKWYADALERRETGRGVAGYVTLGVDTAGEVVDLYEPGLLKGAAGVGLALLAGLGEGTPDWDRFLLLSADVSAPHPGHEGDPE